MRSKGGEVLLDVSNYFSIGEGDSVYAGTSKENGYVLQRQRDGGDTYVRKCRSKAPILSYWWHGANPVILAALDQPLPVRCFAFLDPRLAQFGVLEGFDGSRRADSLLTALSHAAAISRQARRHYGDRFDIPLRKVDGREDVADAIALVAMAARSIGRPIDEDHLDRLRAVRTPRWNNGEDT